MRPNKAQQGDSLPVGSSLAFWLRLRFNLTRKLSAFVPRTTCAQTFDHNMNPEVEPILRQAHGLVGFFNRFLPTKSCQVAVKSSFSRSDCIILLREAFHSWGHVVRDDLESLEPVILALVGSGVCNMNPTVLEASLGHSDNGETEVLLTAHAKEGLIRQRTAEKAIARYRPILENAKKIEPCATPNAGSAGAPPASVS